jgi:transcriptional regulator with XRE-family HTH domain
MSNGALSGVVEQYRSDPEFIAETCALEILEKAVILMERDGVTRAELARSMGVTRSAVSQLFKKGGHNLTLLTMARLAASLNVTLQCDLVSSDSDVLIHYSDVIWRPYFESALISFTERVHGEANGQPDEAAQLGTAA